MELAAKKLEDDQIKRIAADPWALTGPHETVRLLLCHIAWLNEELERVSEERDTFRDVRDSGGLASQLKCARVLLDDICKELDVPRTESPTMAVRMLKAQCEQLKFWTPEPPLPANLTLKQIHHLLEFLKNAAHVYYTSNGGRIGG